MQPTILLVDDVAVVRHVLRRAIVRSQPGAAVVEAATVQDALDILKHSMIAVLVTDYHLPDGDGLSILHAARQHDPRVPVFVMSADASVAGRAAAVGATAFFAKPLDVHQFIAAIKQLQETFC